jgi:ubiquinone/menaquinone biosynthesis C-methylase UbiE
MKQNIYDNEEFFDYYINMRKNRSGLNEVLEQPAFMNLVPDLKGKRVLDLGCGFGENCKTYENMGASEVVGLDISEKMLAIAKDKFSSDRIKYIHSSLEDMNFDENSFDVILSSLTFHYVKDLNELIRRLSKYITKDGILLFSIEHPIATAKIVKQGWVKDESGNKDHWVMDNYQDEGLRHHKWVLDDVIKYHRTISTTLNTLIENGFNILKVDEPAALESEELKKESLKEERRRPPFLIVKCRKD